MSDASRYTQEEADAEVKRIPNPRPRWTGVRVATTRCVLGSSDRKERDGDYSWYPDGTVFVGSVGGDEMEYKGWDSRPHPYLEALIAAQAGQTPEQLERKSEYVRSTILEAIRHAEERELLEEHRDAVEEHAEIVARNALAQCSEMIHDPETVARGNPIRYTMSVANTVPPYLQVAMARGVVNRLRDEFPTCTVNYEITPSTRWEGKDELQFSLFVHPTVQQRQPLAMAA